MVDYRAVVVLIFAFCCTGLSKEGNGTPCQSEDSIVMMQTTTHVKRRTSDQLQANKVSINIMDSVGKEYESTHLQESTEYRNKDAHNASKQGQTPCLKHKSHDTNYFDLVTSQVKILDLEHLKTCRELQSTATEFDTEVESCIAAMNASVAAHTRDFQGTSGVVQEGFDCLHRVLLVIVSGVRNCAATAYYAVDSVLPDDNLIQLWTADDVVFKAANALEIALHRDMLTIRVSPNASTMCDLVAHDLSSLENAVASLLLSMSSFDIIAVLDKFKGNGWLVEFLTTSGLLDSLSEVRKAALAISASVPRPLRRFQDAINSILNHGLCNEALLPHAGPLDLPISLPMDST